jgi:hypothetical protein
MYERVNSFEIVLLKKRVPPGLPTSKGPPKKVFPYIQPSRLSETASAVVHGGLATSQLEDLGVIHVMLVF